MAGSQVAGERVTVLAVASQAILDCVRRIVGHSSWDLVQSGTVADATGLLHRHPGLVVLCEAILPDGTWRDVLHHSMRLPEPPPVIVAARQADECLWVNVLNAGGYNLLPAPFEDRELFQVISMAWRHRAQGGKRAAAH